MANARLSSLDKDFYSRLIRESDATLRRYANAACRYAVEKSQLKFPAVDTALKAFAENRSLTADEHAELGKVVKWLDNVHITTDIRDRDKTGRTESLSSKAALFQARAANAVFMTANPDALYAAIEAIYEAYLTTGNWEELKAILTESK
jgi:hypothetical protein